MLAKKVLKTGIDIDSRISEQIAQHRNWKKLYDEVGYSLTLENILEDILENKESEIQELIRTKKNLEDIIMENNDSDQREILRQRYFDGLSWDCIADHFGFDTTDWVKEQHRKALKKIHLECSCDDEDDFYAEEE